MKDLAPLLVVAIAYALLRALFLFARKTYHGWRLPPPSITSAHVGAFQRQTFQEICRRASRPGQDVRMTDYFDGRGWNHADALLIVAEPLKHQMIKTRGWRFGVYCPTRKGWAEYRTNFMWTGSEEAVQIFADNGSFVATNINSPHASVQVRHGNTTDQRHVSNRQLIEALREDARRADGDEAVRAQEYADDLAEAVRTESSDRVNRVLGRVNALLATAQSAFSLTRELLPPSS
ncbi:hypothetical protein [Streptomyces sp. NPDC056061]|uniref:hypothetical protein n=1 Tax=Streptomyces sp. NPDC056061 TaxID=3345700 RepID=UPI0035D5BBC6